MTGETRTLTSIYPGSRRATLYDRLFLSSALKVFLYLQINLCHVVRKLTLRLPCVPPSRQALMRDLEEKEKELNKLKIKADGLLNNNHPASDKIQVRFSFFFSLDVCLS